VVHVVSYSCVLYTLIVCANYKSETEINVFPTFVIR
jgi:hypothetical protein